MGLAVLGFDLAMGVPVQMADGVRLKAEIYRPTGGGRRPALLALTPYTAAYAHRSASAYAREGFAVVVVDVRGRGGSEGVFDLYNDAADGAACVQWVGAQQWCDGQVALFGSSYSGLNQWSIAALAPPELKAIAPVVAPMPGYDADGVGGLFPFYNLRWTSFIRGRAIHQALFADDAFWHDLALRHYRSGAGIDALPDLLGGRDPVLARMITEFDNAAFWAARVPDMAGFARIAIPVLSVTGTADNAQRGALEYRRRHLAARPDAVHFLLVGGWNHAGLRDPAREPDDPCTTDSETLEKAEHETLAGFYDWVLRGGPRPALLDDPTRLETIFVGGAERWVRSAAAQCPQLAAWYLGGARDFSVQPPPAPITIPFPPLPDEALDTAPDLFTLLSGENPGDPAFCDPARGAFVTFTGAPLAREHDWIGAARLDLTVTAAPGACDLAAILYEQRADDRVFVLSSDMRRVGFDDQAPVTVTFDRFRLAARRLKAGSRIGLQLRLIDTPQFQRPPMMAAHPALCLGPGCMATAYMPLSAICFTPESDPSHA